MGKKKFSNELDALPNMTTWFAPIVLLKTAWRKISATLFGEYADNRLIQASLNPINSKTLEEDTNFRRLGNLEQGIWIDYVADTGDGFDSTYSVAYLLGREELGISGETQSLPRGQALIMGGDQVYPFATNSDYKIKLLKPYDYSFPKEDDPKATHPPLFLIPGNHDWYDGLRIFSALFCRGKSPYEKGSYHFGRSSWQNYQKRSYFAIELANNWWIWSIDTQLTEDVDKPQSDYFYEVAKLIKKKNKTQKIKIILCVSEPTWLYMNKDKNTPSNFDTGVLYIQKNIIKEILPEAKIYAVLTGDSHHYNHYKAEKLGTHFITAGGGGAFLHPTHHLDDEISDIQWGETHETLVLEKDLDINEDTCFPKREESRKLALGNWKFPFINKKFFLILGSVYLFFSALFAASGQLPLNFSVQNMHMCIADIILFLFQNLVLVILLLLFLWMGHINALKDDKKNLKIAAFSGYLHGAIHFCWLLVCIYLFETFYQKIHYIQFVNPSLLFIEFILRILLLSFIVGIYFGRLLPILIGLILFGIYLLIVFHSPYFIAFSLWILLVGGFIGSWIFGIYLLVVSYRWDLQWNDAFSAMKLSGYKNFLRLHLQDDNLTIYSIGIKDIPTRKDWVRNSSFTGKNQNEPKYKPRSKTLKPQLIERPIIIKWDELT